MKNVIFSAAVVLLLASAAPAYAQSTDKELAYKKAIEAIGLMDNGNVDESIVLLREAQKLDPDRFDYPYELAYAHYLKKDYKTSVKILEKAKIHKDATDLAFQLLGNSYDLLGKTAKAFESYDAGLEKFPNSGIIHLEKGNMFLARKKYDEALWYYEKGIEVDPQFPSNYYRAALLYLNSEEEVWGMIYGEIFMNLERNSKRTAEISKLLFDTYKSEINFKTDTGLFEVSFSKFASININDLNDGKLRLPYGITIYEPILIMSTLSADQIDLKSLNHIRSAFVDHYYESGHDKTYPNVLFEYQKKIKEAGHMESYNYWILMKGDEAAFNAWYDANGPRWEAFIKWFTDNGLRLDADNRFYRAQY